MNVEHATDAIWEAVLDSYSLNVELALDERVVYQSAWERELKARIRAILRELDDGD